MYVYSIIVYIHAYYAYINELNMYMINVLDIEAYTHEPLSYFSPTFCLLLCWIYACYWQKY